MNNVLELFKPIRAFVFDVDGVLTDGTLLVLDGGLQVRKMNIKDGFALQMALKKGYRVKIISGGNSPEVQDRLEKLGVKDVSMQVLDKKKLLTDYITGRKLKKEQVLFMGDDLPDIPALQSVGLACCPADAVSEVKEAAHYISHLKGGEACVRDVIEKVLRLNDHWQYSGHLASK
jgi:3-deoxy-D-manno-octulosonate 8-phosphate phosphatase (KDO 8-P phosphatase)